MTSTKRTPSAGERRDFVVIDGAGGLHALGKRILDVTAAKIRDRLSDLSRQELPTVEMARAFIQEHGQEKSPQQEKAAPAWDRDRADRKWQDAVINASIEKEKDRRQFVEPPETKSTWKPGRAGNAEKEVTPYQSMPEPPTTSPIPQFTAVARETREAATTIKDHASSVLHGSLNPGTAIGNTALRSFGKTLDVIGSAVESLFASAVMPEQGHDKAPLRREAEAESEIDFSRYTTQMAQQRLQRENQREAERQHRDGAERDR